MGRKIILCESCRSNVEYITKTNTITEFVKGKEVNYLQTKAFCKECEKEIFVEEINDENILNFKTAAISINSAEQSSESITDLLDRIIIKYSIGKKPLSLVLGWSEVTVSRYYAGTSNPTAAYKETLEKVLNDSGYFKSLLDENKSKISNIAFQKSLNATNHFLKYHNAVKLMNKIDEVTKYLLVKCEDITPLALQKLLYYAQSFNKVFNGKFLFDEDCEAWVHGPVYRRVYDEYKEFGYNVIGNSTINEEDFELISFAEKEVLDSIVNNFGCYSGKVLENMTHLETPWLLTRKDLKENEFCDEIISKELMKEYFQLVKKKYDLLNPSDVKDYSSDLFYKIN